MYLNAMRGRYILHTTHAKIKHSRFFSFKLSSQPKATMPPPSPYHSNAVPRQRGPYNERDFEEIYYHFDDYAAEILMSNSTTLLSDLDNPEQYEAEDRILDEASQYELESMKQSALFGLGCGVVSFGLMRWRRGGGLLTVSRYSSRSSGGYKFDPIDKSTMKMPSSFQQQQDYRAPKSSGMLLHTTLSTIFGTGATLVAIDTDLFYPAATSESPGNSNKQMITPPPQWISPQIPLVPGRSVVSDLLCQSLTEEFRKFPKELWQSGNLGVENGYNNHIALYANGGWKDTKYYNSNPNAEIVSLGESNGGSSGFSDGKKGIYEQLVVDSLQGFVINCERRARYEKKLRRIRGDRSNSPVVIPRDGVPADEDLELDDIYLLGSDVENSDDSFGL